MVEQGNLNFKLLDWENKRRGLQLVEDVVDAHLETAAGQLDSAEAGSVRQELQAVLQARLTLYSDPITTTRTLLGRLAALQTADEWLIRIVDGQRAFIPGHVLWVRSTAPLAPALVPPLITAVGDLVSQITWQAVATDLLTDLRPQPLSTLLLIPIVWLLVIRRRLLAPA